MSTTALVTGANLGLGLEVARQLGRAGYTVVIGARDPRRATKPPTGCARRALTPNRRR